MTAPRLTIGLIIFNGAGSARKCIDSLLSQTYKDFTLLIFDNASTDGTSEICQEYVSLDKRVLHVRHDKTIPQSENFRNVLMFSTTEYFMWAADDDIWGQRFAELCINELDRNPNAVACCSRVIFNYPDGSSKPARGTFPIEGTRDERVQKYLKNPRDSARLYGVYRSEMLKKSFPRDIKMFGYDWLIVCLSMLYGDHLECPEYELTRSGHSPGKYFEKYDRHFVRESNATGLISWFFPLFPLSRAIKQHLPKSAWRKSRWRVLRLNLLQTFLLLKWKYPKLESTFNFVRSIDRRFGNG